MQRRGLGMGQATLRRLRILAGVLAGAVVLMGIVAALLHRQGESERRVAEAARSAVFAAKLERNGLWTVIVDTSAIDDSQLVTVSVRADGMYDWLLDSLEPKPPLGLESLRYPPSLFIRCAGHDLSIYLYTGLDTLDARYAEAPRADLMSATATVKLRLDRREAETQPWFGVPPEDAYFSPSPAALFEQLASADTLRLQFDFLTTSRPQIALDRTVWKFRIAKLKRHLPLLAADCPSVRRAF